MKLVEVEMTGGIVLIWALSSGDWDGPPCVRVKPQLSQI
jgi:hypothetical protein